MTRRPPLVFRLMLCTLFLPIVLGLGVLWCALWYYAPDVWTNQDIMLGLPYTWFMFAQLGLPFVLWLWMLWSGRWRLPVLCAGIVYFTSFFIAAFELVKEHTPPEKRMVKLDGIKGTDVYCNGILLGRLPLKIRVDELKSKVPEWSTPPEQRWYDDTEPPLMLYTCFPWDDFRKERFEASKELFGANNKRTVSNVPKAVKARREALNKHDADCRYWWSFRLGEARMAFYRDDNPRYLNTPFDRESTYNLQNCYTSFSPSAVFHAQLLVDVLPELTPEQKADWDRHVLEHWPLLTKPLGAALNRTASRHRTRDKNDPIVKLYENALHSTARLKYGLSDPPMEDQCRRLLSDWVAESIDHELFHFDNVYDSGTMNGNPSTAIVSPELLFPAGIREPMRKPLAEQWKKNQYRYEEGWAPLAFFSGTGKSPLYFADFARYSATTSNARIALLGNEDPAAATLFKTLLDRSSLANYMTKRIYLYPTKIEAFTGIDNPRAEDDFRRFIVEALSDPDHNDSSRETVDRAVFNAVFARIRRKDADKEELAAWVSSLPMKASSKNLALRMLRIHGGEAKTFADRLQQAAGPKALIETDLTLDDVTKWFAEHPEGNLARFFGEQEDVITVGNVFDQTYRGRFSISASTDFQTSMVGWHDGSESHQYEMWAELPKCFVLALLRSDTPEGDPKVRTVIRQLWANSNYAVETAIATEYGTANPLRYGEVHDAASAKLPDYLLDLCEGTDSPHPFGLAPTLALCDSSRAGTLLEKWIDEAGTAAKPRIERCLEIWRTRNALRQKKMELFRDLVAGRIGPDDLLLKQPSWNWKGGRYVQSEP